MRVKQFLALANALDQTRKMTNGEKLEALASMMAISFVSAVAIIFLALVIATSVRDANTPWPPCEGHHTFRCVPK